MSKKVIIGAASVVLLGAGAYGVTTLLNNNDAPKQQTANLSLDNAGGDTSKASKKAAKNEATTTEVAETTTEKPAETSAEPTAEATPVEGGIHANINDIFRITKGVNRFTRAAEADYNQIVDNLSKFHVTVDPSVKGPFGVFDPDRLVFAGEIVNEKLNKVSDNRYEIELEVRTGQSPIIDDDYDYTATAIQEALLDDSFNGYTRRVVYAVDVSEDGQSATMTRTTDNWW